MIFIKIGAKNNELHTATVENFAQIREKCLPSLSPLARISNLMKTKKMNEVVVLFSSFFEATTNIQ